MTPSGWDQVPLGSAGEWLSGGTPSKKDPSLWIGAIPWVSPKDMKRARLRDVIDHVSEVALGNGTQLAPSGSLLMVVRGMILAHTFPVARAERSLAFNQDVKALVPSSAFDSDFLLYFLQDSQSEVLRLVDVANHGTKRLPSERLFALDVPRPPLGEQRKIAAILSSVDDAIEATKAVINQLQVVKKAMMAELLTRGLPGRHTRFKMTEIGEVPEEWEVVTLGEITKESAFGPRFPATQYSDSGNVGTVRTTDLTDAWEIDYTTIPRAALDPSVVRPHLLEDGDLLVSRSGTCGVVCIFRKQPIDMLPAAFLIRFRLQSGVNEEFVRLAMMVPAAQNRVQAMAAGGVQKNLSGTNLATLQLARPPLDEQAGIVAAVSVLDVRLRAEAAVCHQLRAAKSALMSVLLTGEVRVKPDESAA